MSKKRLCPNCANPVANHPHNGCVLNALVHVVRDRGHHSEERLRQLHATCDVDALWERIGPIIDNLEDGEFSHD